MITLDNLTKNIHYRSRDLVRNNWLFKSRLEYLKSNERISKEQLGILQEKLIRLTLETAKCHIPIYQGLHLPVNNFRKYLQELPIVTKYDLLKNQQGFYPALKFSQMCTPKGRTSGTTGTPLEIYRSLDSVIWEHAFLQQHWSWSGYRPGIKRASLRGNTIVPTDQISPPFWFFNKPENELFLSSRHLSPPYIEHIISKIRSFQPYLIQAYPSTIFELATYLKERGECLNIPFVYTGSEMLYPYQREIIVSILNTKIMDFYGMAERVAFAAECEYGNYHVNSEYSYVEIVDEAGKPTRDEGYIVGTTFHNHTMPLIRYQLSDRSRWQEGSCPCGRTHPMIQPIAGKFEDVVFGSMGNPISPSIITFAFKGLKYIERSQVAQVGEGCWEVRIVPSSGFGIEERIRLVNNFHTLVDPKLAIKVVECTDIARTTSGKFRWVVNEWKSNSVRSDL